MKFGMQLQSTKIVDDFMKVVEFTDTARSLRMVFILDKIDASTTVNVYRLDSSEGELKTFPAQRVILLMSAYNKEPHIFKGEFFEWFECLKNTFFENWKFCNYAEKMALIKTPEIREFITEHSTK